MIQINLLPDVKLQYIKSQRSKRMVYSIAALAAGAALGMTLLLALHVYVNQAGHTSRLQKNIDESFTQFQAIPNISTILTVREQILELPTLHSQKPAVTRLPDVLAKIITNDVNINELSVDFVGNTIRLSGQGNDVVAINTFADVLKNTLYSSGDGGNPARVFSGVQFNIGVKSDKKISFDTAMTFDPIIFDINNSSVELSVPNIVSTQSALRSGSLFDIAPKVLEPQL